MIEVNSFNETVLQMLKIDLGKLSPSEDTEAFLAQKIQEAREAVTIEGMTIDENSVGDAAIVEMYAAYLYRRRADTENGMPRMLRYMLNNRIFHEKGSVQ